MTKGIVFSVSLAIILLAACSPSPQVIQTAIAKTQAAWSTDAVANIPKPAQTSLATEQAAVISTQQSDYKYDMILSDIADNLRSHLDEVDSVTTIRRGADFLEIEIKAVGTSKDNQPNVTFEAIHLLAMTFGNMSEENALKFTTGNPQHFSILLTTYSINGDHQFTSLTFYNILEKVINEQLSFIDWVSEANAHFVN